jgi:hypothetical protein
MLTVYGSPVRMCDGVNRRSFLRIGTLGIGTGALSLADVFRSEVRAKSSSSHKAVINVFLGGGPPHQDTFDLKPEAPSEVRGEFKPIATNVTGIQIGEVFPRMSKLMDRCALIRSVVGATGRHDAVQCMSGWTLQDLAPLGGYPSLGSAITRLQGPVDPSVPAFIGLAQPTKHVPWSDAGRPGFLGTAYQAFKPDGQGLANMKLKDLTTEQLASRKSLLSQFDSMRRDVEVNGNVTGLDAYTQRAFDVLTSSRLMEALDLSRESSKVRDRYGDGQPYNYQYDGAPTVNDHLLMARRLVEAGARVVTLTFGRWDSHSKNFDLVRDHGSKLDQALSALVEDLEARGMLNDVCVVVWGEFGRTPRINNNAGRDHWPQVSCALLAGGGLKVGQVIGSTNRLGEYAATRPVHFQEVHATLYHALGLNPATTTIQDASGRPQHVAGMPAISELI